MVTVHDVAAYILRRHGRMSAMKLQKLVYYAQAWLTVWSLEPLFPERIEAWAKGPVAPDLYQRHRGRFEISAWPTGDPDALDEVTAHLVNTVLDYYAPHSAEWLSELTHNERPWQDARRHVPPSERSHQEITPEMLRSYYGAL